MVNEGVVNVRGPSQAAEMAQARLEALPSRIKDAFFVLDHDWQFTDINERVCQVTGMERAAEKLHQFTLLIADITFI